MSDHPTLAPARDPRRTARYVLHYLGPYALPLGGVLILALLGMLFGLLGPYLLGLAIDRFIQQGDLPGLLRLSAVLFLTFVGAWMAPLGQGYAMTGIAQRALHAMRRDLFAHLPALSFAFFHAHPAGQLTARLNADLEAVAQALAHGLGSLVGGLLMLAGLLVAMLVLNLWLALAMSALLAILLLLSILIGRRLRRGERETRAKLESLEAVVAENLAGARLVQGFGRQAAAVAELHQVSVAVREAGVRWQSADALLPSLHRALANLAVALLVGLGGWLALRGQASVGLIAAFIVYSWRLFGLVLSLAAPYHATQAGLAGAERLLGLLDEQGGVPDKPEALDLGRAQGTIEFDQVGFSDREGIPALTDITFTVEPGQVVALVGPDSSGKTTLVNLLSRCCDVTAGVIRLDGYDLRDLKQDSLHRQIALLPQDPCFFSTSVLENIRYGRLDASDEECIAAARLAQADSFIRRLPAGYHTELSERADILSQGQRQLLAIARMALSDPALLILDEATSAVDPHTGAVIQQALLRLMRGRTCLVVSREPVPHSAFDQVLRLEGGRLVAQGAPISSLGLPGPRH